MSLYAQKSANETKTLTSLLSGFEFICGTSLQEMILNNNTPEQIITSQIFVSEN